MNGEPTAGEELARRVGRRVRNANVAANSLGATVVFVLLAFIGAEAEPAALEQTDELIGLFVAFGIVTFGALNVILGRATQRALRPLAEDRPFDGSEREALLGLPWFHAQAPLVGWAGAGTVFGLWSALRAENQIDDAALLGVTILLGGMTVMALVFLTVERILRPVVAIALAGRSMEARAGVGIRSRLLLTWLLGSAIPFVALVTGLLQVEAGDLTDARRLVLPTAGVAVIAGALVTTRAARSVSEPLGELRNAVSRIGQGDFDAVVDVDDATEVGQLQAGFNEMVTGLRERERLQDLFGRHVGVDVAQQAFERGVELGGEIREASALFVDLTGSTGLAATRSPQEVVGLLNEFFAAVVEATDREGGWVNKFEGDAALCVFGVPADQPDHAARALRAARVLAERLSELRDRYPELDAGIGVSSGEVVAGNVGTEQRYEYTVIGDPVNEAARLGDEAKTRPGRVLAAEPVIVRARSTEPTDGWCEAATLELRGRTEPTRTFEPA